MRGGEHDVLPHRVPHRAVLLVGQRDRARHGVGRHVPLDADLQMHADDAVRIVLGAVGDQVRSQIAKRLTRPGQDVADVHGHAAGQRERERLHRRWSSDAGAVERHRRGPAGAGKDQVAGPGQIDHRRWFGHERDCSLSRTDGTAEIAEHANKNRISPFFASFPVPSYRAAERPGTGAACGGKIGLFVTIDLIAIHASGRTTSRYVSTWPKALSGPHASVLLWRISLYGRYCCSDISCTPLITSCTTNTKRKMAVAWKNSARLTRWPNRDHSQATPPAARLPSAAPSTRFGVWCSCISSSAVSTPSRLIIRSVNRNTPVNAAAPGRAVDSFSRPSISPFMRRPVRHMWTIIQATETAATSASGPSSHSWLRE